MSEKPRSSHPIYSLLPMDIEGFGPLTELALDLRWSWNHGADEVWQQLDADLRDRTRYPRIVLQTVSRGRIENLFADPVFRTQVSDFIKAKRQN